MKLCGDIPDIGGVKFEIGKEKCNVRSSTSECDVSWKTPLPTRGTILIRDAVQEQRAPCVSYLPLIGRAIGLLSCRSSVVVLMVLLFPRQEKYLNDLCAKIRNKTYAPSLLTSHMTR